MTLPIVALHGFTGSPASFDAVRALLPTQLDWHLPLLLGHGKPPVALDLSAFEQEVERLARELPHGPCLLVGYSLGARLALALGARYPERVHAAIWISGRDGLLTEAERQARRAQDAEHIRLLEQTGLASFVQAWEALPLFASQRALPEGVQRRQRLERSGHTAAGLAQSLRVTGLAEMPYYGGALGAIHASVTLLVGAADVAFCQHAAAVVGNLRNGNVTALPGAGHNLLLERPAEVASAIERGLQA